jgi:hypothetical protein
LRQCEVVNTAKGREAGADALVEIAPWRTAGLFEYGLKNLSPSASIEWPCSATRTHSRSLITGSRLRIVSEAIGISGAGCRIASDDCVEINDCYA